MSNQEIQELKSRISDLELGLQTVEDDLEMKSEEAAVSYTHLTLPTTERV